MIVVREKVLKGGAEMAGRRDAGAPLMFGLRACVLPGGSEMPRITRREAAQERPTCEKGPRHQRPGQLDSGSYCLCMESGAGAQIVTKIPIN